MESQRTDNWPSYEFRAMGSHIQLWLDADEWTAPFAFRSAQNLFSSIEVVLSRFDPSSELSRMNARSGQWTAVSPLMWRVLNRALELARETGGLFDPTILPALEQAGYTRDFDEIRRGEAVTSLPQKPGKAQPGRWADIKTDPVRRRVCLPAGVKIDLGGIAKGWTADLAVRMLDPYGPCLVDAGGDLAAGDAPTGEPGWPIGVAAPSSDDSVPPADLLMVWLRRGSIATSGVDWRRWEHGGAISHHLIDPRTGLPAQTDLVTATVLAADAAQAEAWATTSLVLGRERALAELCPRGTAAALVDAAARVTLTPALEPYLVERQAA